MRIKLGDVTGAAIAATLLAPGASASAQTPLAAPPSARSEPASGIRLQHPIVTRHAGTFNGRRVSYAATIEPFDVTGLDSRPAARLVAISYVAEKAAVTRPVIFVFNGGPITASSTLHIGALGPKRLAIPDDVSAPAARFALTDNPYTVLDVADLVFFDPAGTGFSRIADGVDPATQFSNAADARQLAQLVVAWCRQHGRTASPKYLLGESYGTIRAPEAAAQLARDGVSIDGLVLLGQAVNILEYSQRRTNVVSYAVSLPTLAAIAWEHGKADRRDRSFDQFEADARSFAAEYLATLYLGASAPIERQRKVAQRLQEFTGITADWYLAHQLRITKVEFQRALLPGQRLASNDARYAGPADGPDPFDVVTTAYADSFATYLAQDLGARDIGSYVVRGPFTGGLNDWGWGLNRSPFGDWPYGTAITELFANNARFRLLVGNGWTDTQTTVGAMDYLVNQFAWPRDRVRTAAYRGGHMSYTVEASLKSFTDDVRATVTGAW